MTTVCKGRDGDGERDPEEQIGEFVHYCGQGLEI
jgi:hypothetical protein